MSAATCLIGGRRTILADQIVIRMDEARLRQVSGRSYLSTQDRLGGRLQATDTMGDTSALSITLKQGKQMSESDSWYAQPIEVTPQQRLERKIIALAAANAELMLALEEIARKKKLDATAAASMKAIATKALNAAGVRC